MNKLGHINLFTLKITITRMHSSRMRTACSLTVSRRILRMPPRGKTIHTAQEKPCTPTQEKPCMPPGEKPRMPPRKTTHAPPGKKPHTPPPTWQNPCMPPQKKPHMPPSKNHACCPSPQQKLRLPPHNHMPLQATTHAPPVNRITDACENITFANYVCGR